MYNSLVEFRFTSGESNIRYHSTLPPPPPPPPPLLSPNEVESFPVSSHETLSPFNAKNPYIFGKICNTRHKNFPTFVHSYNLSSKRYWISSLRRSGERNGTHVWFLRVFASFISSELLCEVKKVFGDQVIFSVEKWWTFKGGGRSGLKLYILLGRCLYIFWKTINFIFIFENKSRVHKQMSLKRFSLRQVSFKVSFFTEFKF